MARKHKVKPPTTLEKVTQLVTEMLSADKITPDQMFTMITLGYQCYKSGSGQPWEHVMSAILTAFHAQGRPYLHPCQMAALCGRSEPQPQDWVHLSEA